MYGNVNQDNRAFLLQGTLDMPRFNFNISVIFLSLFVTAFSLPVNAQSVEELKAQLAALAKRIDELEKKQEKAAEKKAVIKKRDPAPAFGTSDGVFEANIRGRIIADLAVVKDRDNTHNLTATEFRDTRIGIEGKAFGNIKYKLEADFANNEVGVTDAYIQYNAKNGLEFTVGQFKTPNSLEEQASTLDATFVERAVFTDAFSLNRRIGFGVSTRGDNYTLSAGVFGGSDGESFEVENFTIAARATYGGEIEDGKWITGASYRYENAGEQPKFRFRARPNNSISARFVETNRIVDRTTFVGIEAAIQKGAFYAASEWSRLDTSIVEGSTEDATFNGGYAEAGWFITGEHKGLSLSKGTWTKTRVKDPLHKGGPGAIQLAARFDYLDLTDGDVFGGEYKSYTAGINWFLNDYVRVTANYSHSVVKEAFDVDRNGADGENSVDSLVLRFQTDW